MSWSQYYNTVLPTLEEFFDAKVLLCYLAYVFGLILLNVTIPVRDRVGIPLITGERLNYNLNGASTTPFHGPLNLVLLTSGRQFFSS